MAALKKVAEVKQVSCGVVGFRLAPRLNAAGRLEDAALGEEARKLFADAQAMLKRIVADQMLDMTAMKELLAKNW